MHSPIIIIKSFAFIVILVLAALCETVTAQTATVNGTVIENQNRLPVVFASVSVVRKTDSVIVAGTLSQQNGHFAISGIGTGEYLLRVISIGYQPASIPFSVKSNKPVELDSVGLFLSDKHLSDVTVTGKRNWVASRMDKQTYKADLFGSAKGGNAVDILKNLPSVTVNGSGEISVRGATGFLVLINGKPVLADAQTVLSQLAANTIENIELITAPSARYDADGRAGIINIVTTKGTTDGIAIQANLQPGLPGTTHYNNLEKPKRFGGDLTLNFRKNKWDISLSGNYTRNDANGMREGDVFTINDVSNSITRFPSNGERSFDRYNYGLRAAITYAAGKNNVFAVGFFTSKKYQQRRADITYHNTTTDQATGMVNRQLSYFNSNLQTKQGDFTLGSADYTHTFQNSSKLSLSAIYEYANLFGNTFNQNLALPGKNFVFQLVTNPYSNPISGYRLKLDYSISIGKGKLETGYQFRNDEQDGTFDYTITPTTNQPDSALFRGQVRSANHVNAVYAQYSGRLAKLQYTAGLRYENAFRQVFLSYDSRPHLLRNSNLFPSANLLYTFDNNWSAKAGYSKRIQRNNNFELNPIPEREHSETLEQGDPDLLPQFIDLAELGITRNFKQGSFFSTLYYQKIANPIQRVNSVYADTILNRLFTNAEKARLIGLEMGANVKPIKWLSVYLGANIYYYLVSGRLNVLGAISEVNNADGVFSLNMNNTFDLGKNWMLQTNVNYISARPTAQGRDSRFISPNSSVKKTFGNGRFSLMLQWQNMDMGWMQANRQRITTSGRNFYTTTNYIYETDVLLLNFSVSISKLSSKAKLPASELGEKEF